MIKSSASAMPSSRLKQGTASHWRKHGVRPIMLEAADQQHRSAVKRPAILNLVRGTVGLLLLAAMVFTIKALSIRSSVDAGEPDMLRKMLASRRDAKYGADISLRASSIRRREQIVLAELPGNHVDYAELERKDRERREAASSDEGDEATLVLTTDDDGVPANLSPSGTPRASPSSLPTPSLLPKDYDPATFGDDEVGAAVWRHAARPFHAREGPVVADAYKPGDRDTTLLEKDEAPPLRDGMELSKPSGRVTPDDDSDVVAARAASEAAAEMAIVVVTAPRSTIMNRDARLRHYFRGSIDCGGAVYRRVVCPPHDAQGCADLASQACDDDPECVGFTGLGGLMNHVDTATCGVPIRSTMLDGSALSAERGVFLKSPMPIVPVPRKITLAGAQWWRLSSFDVRLSDIAQHDTPVTGGGTPEERVVASGVVARCTANPACRGFNYPGQWMKNSTRPTELVLQRLQQDLALYSRDELPPQEYVVATTMSILDELGDDCSAGGAFGGKVHLYIFDTSRREWAFTPTLQQSGDNPRLTMRGPQSDDYWFRAFAWLRQKYGRRRCVTFQAVNTYARFSEARVQGSGRGMPEWQADNRGRRMPRGQVAQTLDFASALRHALGRSPRAHVLLSEDDNHFCSGMLRALHDGAAAVARFDPSWGALKVGNGGSGILFHGDVVPNLISYLVTRRGSDNVDVSMWRYLHSGQHSDYLSRTTLSAHRGLQSSFKMGFIPVWGRVKCGGALDRCERQFDC